MSVRFLFLAGLALSHFATTPQRDSTSAFDLAIGQTDPAMRATALAPFVDPADPVRHQEALDALADCGPAAVEVLRSLAADETHFRESSPILRALVSAGGKAALPVLEQLLRDDKTYWNNLGMNLDDTDKIPVFRIDRLVAILEHLAPLGYRDGDRLVRELRAQFDDHPLLRQQSQIIEAADVILSRQ